MKLKTLGLLLICAASLVACTKSSSTSNDGGAGDSATAHVDGSVVEQGDGSVSHPDGTVVVGDGSVAMDGTVVGDGSVAMDGTVVVDSNVPMDAPMRDACELGSCSGGDASADGSDTSDGAASDAGPTRTPIAIDDFARAAATLYCNDTCSADQDGDVLAILKSTFTGEACISRLTTAIENAYVAPMRAGVVGSSIQYDGANARHCMDRYEGLACGSRLMFSFDTICADDNVFYGSGGDGAGCAGTQDCKPNHYCTNVGSLCSAQVCKPRSSAGGPCVGSADCLPGAGTMGLCGDTCMEFTYVNVRTGDYCGNGEGSLSVCSDGSRCSGGTCQAVAGIGDTCSSGSECAAGLICLGDRGGTCQPLALAPSVGDACGIIDGAPTLCDPLANIGCQITDVHAFTGTCVATGGDEHRCLDAMFDPYIGTSCGATEVCGGSLMEGAVLIGQCTAAPRGAGETCSAGVDCISGTCDHFTCTDICAD